MALKRTTVTKLASLSAIGMGAMVTGETANASVVFSGVLDEGVGFNGSAHSFSASLGSLMGFRFATNRENVGSTGNAHIWRVFGTGVGGLEFAAQSGHMQVFGSGATWGQRSSSGTKQAVGERFFGANAFSHSTSGGNPAFSNEFALIHFGPGAGEYGWIELSLQLNNAGGSDGANGPNVTLISYAYDDSGAFLGAGETTAMPEPATYELSGMAALVLGAVGVRRWRSPSSRVS